MRTVAFCEIEPYCRAVLRKHWPDVPIYEDVRELTAGRLHADGISVDVVCGGFPCQDISQAGKRAGLDGERSGLWREYARLIRELRPRYVIVENVAALLSRGMGQVLGDLAEGGYDAEWHCIPASSIGAPHIRDRVWLVAYPRQEQRLRPVFTANDAEEEIRTTARLWGADWIRFEMGGACRSLLGRWMDKPDPPGMVDGVSDWSHRLGAIGNAVVPQIPELLGRAIMQAEAERVAA